MNPFKPRTEEIAIDLIDFDIPNDRHTMDKTKLNELAESIRANGLEQAISVYEKTDGRYCMGFGHRRLAAHKLLERNSIRADIYPMASEIEIRTARAIENLHRADLTPLEEAESVETLAATHDGNADQVAAIIGRTPRWVESRLTLLRLSPRVRQILIEGDLTIAHALLLARLPDHVRQDELAGRAAATHETIRGTQYDHPPMTLHDLRDLVGSEVRDLNNVPWLLEVEFAGKVACAGCPHNSDNTPQLFDGEAPKKPLCLDASCFAVKTKAAQQGMRRASNTLVKETSARSPKAAQEAAEKREAGFLKPKAVLEAAARAMKPSEKTKAEKQGRAQSSADIEVEQKLQAALRKWRNENCLLVAAQIRKHPLQVSVFLLLKFHPDWILAFETYGVGKKKKQEAQQRVIELLNELKTPTDASFLKFVKLTEKAIANDVNTETDFPLDDLVFSRDEEIIVELMRDVFGLTFAARPKREDFATKSVAKEPAPAKANTRKAAKTKVVPKGKTKKKAGKK